MHRLLLFLRKSYVLLLFLILEGFAIYHYANSSTYTKAKLLTTSNMVVGSLYNQIGSVQYFFSLGKTNSTLENKVQRLENELAFYREYYGEAKLIDITDSVESPYEYVVARVVRNSVNKTENYLMVDKGRRDGVERGMSVVSLDGYMVGYVEGVSESNAICVSTLNKTFRASGSIVGTDHYGSISWSGRDARYLMLSEIPKYAQIALGDSVRTTGYSFYFPEGIEIGTIAGFSVVESTASYNIDVLMGVDISTLREVMLIRNIEARERFELEADILGAADNQ